MKLSIIRSNIDPKADSADVGQFRAICANRPICGRFRPISGDVCRIRFVFGQLSSGIGQIRAISSNFDRFGLVWGEFGKSGAISVECGAILTEVGRTRPILARFRPISVNCCQVFLMCRFRRIGLICSSELLADQNFSRHCPEAQEISHPLPPWNSGHLQSSSPSRTQHTRTGCPTEVDDTCV